MNNKLFTLFFLLLLCSPIYSQNYQAQKDSLLTIKKQLTQEKNYLNAYTDSLANQINALDQEIKERESELSALKKKLYTKKFGEDVADRITAGRIWKGMTEEMMRAAWGKPDKTNTDKHPWGVFTQYYYGDITYFFKNSKLIDWEETSKNKKQ